MITPELPEVETLRRGLGARIAGTRITAVGILDRKIFDAPDEAIKQDIDGHLIGRVERRDKVLILLSRRPGSAPEESGSDHRAVFRLGPPLPVLQRRAAIRLDAPGRTRPVPDRSVPQPTRARAAGSLHRAQIHPSRLAGSISRFEAHRVHAAIRYILRAATYAAL